MIGYAQNVTIRNLGVVDSYFKGSSAGALVGFGTGGLTIDHSYNAGSVIGGGDGYSYAGGLVGNAASGEITDSYNLGSVDAVGDKAYVGGLAGRTLQKIEKSYNVGSVKGSTINEKGINCVGGLVGYVSGGVLAIVSSYNRGSVESGYGDSVYVGGIIGYIGGARNNSATIDNSFNAGSVKGKHVGGLVGYLVGEDRFYGNKPGKVVVTNGFNEGVVEGTYAGGLVGYVAPAVSTGDGAEVTVVNGYNAGSVKVISGFAAGLVAYQGSKATVALINSHNAGAVNTGSGYGSAFIANAYWNLLTVYNCYASNAYMYSGLMHGFSTHDGYNIQKSERKSATEFSDNTVKGKLSRESGTVNGISIDGSVWTQGETYPILGNAAILYNIVYNWNGGSFAGNVEHVYVHGTELQLPTPTRDGYTFMGWYDNPELSGIAMASIEATAIGNKNLHAKWEKNVELSDGCYQIGSANHLYQFAQLVNDGNTDICGKLTADIVVNENAVYRSFEEQVKNLKDWTPIKNFAGHFDGNGKTISGLYYNNEEADNVGLFESVSSGATISNVGILDSYFKGNEKIGGFVGSVNGTATITNSYFNGQVEGNRYGSTFVGFVSSSGLLTISGGYNIANSYYGYRNPNVFIRYTSHDVSGNAGGLVGAVDGEVTIVNSFSVVPVAGYVGDIGGLVGSVSSRGSATIINSYDAGFVSKGGVNVTDLVGSVYENGSVTISNSYVRTTVNQQSFYNGDIALLLSMGEGGSVWGQNFDEDFSLPNLSGVFIKNGVKLTKYSITYNMGYETPDVIDVYCETFGKAKLLSPSRPGYSFKGWYDNSERTGDLVTSIATTSNEDKTLYAKWEKNLEFVNGCYEIYNAANLYEFARIVNGTHATIAKNTNACGSLVEDIVVNENVLDDDKNLNEALADGFESWTPLRNFSGVIRGNNHTISGLYFNDREVDNVGFVGETSNSGFISNLRISDSYFKGHNKVGVFAGSVHGNVGISYSYSDAFVSGSDSVGGFFGFVSGKTKIYNGYNGSSVIAWGREAGGFVGQTDAVEIYNSACSGPVKGSVDIGSFVGRSNSVPSVEHSFAMKTTAEFLNGDNPASRSSPSFWEKIYFNDGTIATFLHEVDSRWGQTFNDAYSYPDFSGMFVKDHEKLKKYDITYILNYEDRTESAFYYGGVGKKQHIVPIRSGFRFLGWYDNERFSGNMSQDIGSNESGDKTFYAKWEKNLEFVNGCYEIYNAANLYEFAQIVNGTHATIAKNTSACGSLVEDIVVNENVLADDGSLNEALADGFDAWTPMNDFAGRFDGNGKTISGLYFNNEEDSFVGLFGSIAVIGDTVSISDLGVVDSYFKGKENVGGLVGFVQGKPSVITNSYHIGSINGYVGIGGLVGSGNGMKVYNSYHVGSINGYVGIGGLVGSGNGMKVYNSYHVGSVKGLGTKIGALVGYADGLTLDHCFARTGDANGLVGAIGSPLSANVKPAFKSEEEFHNGNVATILHDYLSRDGKNGSIWGQEVTKPNSFPDHSGEVRFDYGSIVVVGDRATIFGNSLLTADVPTPKQIKTVEFDRAFTAGVPSTIVLPFSTNEGTESNATFYAFNGVRKTNGIYSALFIEKPALSNLKANTPYVVILNEGQTSLDFDFTDAVELLTGSPKTIDGGVGDTTIGSISFNREAGWSFVGTYAFRRWDDACTNEECVYGFASRNGTLRNGSTYNAGDFVKAGLNASIYPMRAYLRKIPSSGMMGAPSLSGKTVVKGLPDVIQVEFGTESGEVTAIGQMNTRTGEITLKKDNRWFDMKGRSLGSRKPTAKGIYYYNGQKVIIK